MTNGSSKIDPLCSAHRTRRVKRRNERIASESRMMRRGTLPPVSSYWAAHGRTQGQYRETGWDDREVLDFYLHHISYVPKRRFPEIHPWKYNKRCKCEWSSCLKCERYAFFLFGFYRRRHRIFYHRTHYPFEWIFWWSYHLHSTSFTFHRYRYMESSPAQGL